MLGVGPTFGRRQKQRAAGGCRPAAKAAVGLPVPMPVPAYRKRVPEARQKQQAKQQPGGSAGRHPAVSAVLRELRRLN